MPARWSPRAIGRIRRAPPSGSSRRPPARAYGGMAVWSGDRVRRDEDGPALFRRPRGRDDQDRAATGSARPRSRRRRSPPAWSPRRWRSAFPTRGSARRSRSIVRPDRRGEEEALRAFLKRQLAQFHAARADHLARRAAAQPQRQARPGRAEGRADGMSKPMGPIPAGFAADADGMLLIGGRRADALVDEAGDTPLFVYDLALVDAKIARFRAAFPGVRPALCNQSKHLSRRCSSHVARQVDGLDIASAGELDFALEAGADAARRSASPAPASATASSSEAIAAGVTLNCESEGEVERALAIGAQARRDAAAGGPGQSRFRDQGLGHADGRRRQAVRRRCRARAGSGPADHRRRRRLARLPHLRRLAGARRRRADRGAGARRSRSPPQLAEAAGARAASGQSRRRLRHSLFPRRAAARRREGRRRARRRRWPAAPPILRDSQFAIELGRWLVGEAGVYLTRIVDRKVSHGKTFLVTDGGMHHQLAASGNFGQVVRRNYPVAIATRFGARAGGGGQRSSAASARRSTGSPMTS